MKKVIVFILIPLLFSCGKLEDDIPKANQSPSDTESNLRSFHTDPVEILIGLKFFGPNNTKPGIFMSVTGFTNRELQENVSISNAYICCDSFDPENTIGRDIELTSDENFYFENSNDFCPTFLEMSQIGFPSTTMLPSLTTRTHEFSMYNADFMKDFRFCGLTLRISVDDEDIYFDIDTSEPRPYLNGWGDGSGNQQIFTSSKNIYYVFIENNLIQR
jgi:hypothetical protein